MKIVIATKNKGKIKEIASFFIEKKISPKIELLTFRDFKDFPDVEEGSKSFLENAKIKAKQVAEHTGFITLADDSGLAVDFLDGKPGVISSRYAGIWAGDRDNRIKLLEDLMPARNPSKRTARFICKMVLWDPGKGMLKYTTGICKGSIGFTEIGTNGFGYDPLFIPERYNLTMAEISQAEKNSISHRGKALKKMADYLKLQL